MSSKIPQEIHNLVPEELRDNYGIYWSTRSNRYYVYRDLGYVYDPKIKRSRARRQPLGNIKDHVFSYSPSWLSKQKIKELTSTNKNLQKRVEKSEATQSVRACSRNPKGCRDAEGIHPRHCGSAPAGEDAIPSERHPDGGAACELYREHERREHRHLLENACTGARPDH